MPPRPISNPPNPWHSTALEYLEPPPPARLQIYEDSTRSILSSNDSPDIGFRWSVNPYRGCTHACAYCYARPWHEYLDFGAGTDFDRKIVVKHDAPTLLRQAFERKNWTGELVMFSGATDCDQALEASYGLTRACLEVCLEYHNPVGVITKSPLIERDIDLLAELGRVAHVRAAISIPMWRRENARGLEPYVSSPQRRMQAVAALASAGVHVGINVAPFVPVLSEEGLPELMAAAAEAGAKWVSSTTLRLRGPVQPVFTERLREAFPQRAERILARVRDFRGGELDDPRFGHRMRGTGPYAAASRALFEATAAKAGLPIGAFDGEVPHTFRRPPSGQLSLL